jgi:hypothetical protein
MREQGYYWIKVHESHDDLAHWERAIRPDERHGTLYLPRHHS